MGHSDGREASSSLRRSTYGDADGGEFEKGMALANGGPDTSVCAQDWGGGR